MKTLSCLSCLFLLAAGCTSSAHWTGQSGTVQDEPQGNAADSGSQSGNTAIDDGGDTGVGGSTLPLLDVELSDKIGTVAWAFVEPPADATDVWLEFGLDATYDRSVPVDLTVETPSAELLGLKADHSYDVRAVALIDGATVPFAAALLKTGPVPSELSNITMGGDGSGAKPGGYLFTSLLSDPSYAVVFDSDGDYVWWHRSPVDGAIVARSRPSVSGLGVTYLAQLDAADGASLDPAVGSQVVRVSWDGTETTEEALDSATHDMVEEANGDLLYLAYDARAFEGKSYRGDRLMLRTSDTSGASDQEIWSVWDDFTPTGPADADAGMGWSHANALVFDPDSQTAMISLRRFDALVKIDLQTQSMMWQMGGGGSDFTFTDVDQAFSEQHQFQVLPDGHLLIFDNGSVTRMDSRAAEYAVDWTGRTLGLSWEHHADPVLFNYGPGDVARLDDGNTLVVFGSSGLIELADPSGKTVWSLTGSVGAGFGYVDRVTSLGAG